MKHIFVLFFLTLSTFSFAQTSELKAGYTNIILTVKDTKGIPVAAKKIRLVNTDLSVSKEGITDAGGIVSFVGKVNSNYELYFGNGNVPQKFLIPSTPYQELEIPIVYNPLTSEKIVPGANEVALNISLLDYASVPLSKSFTLENTLTKQKYTLTSDSKGMAQALVAKGAQLTVHFKEAPDYTILPVPAQGGIVYNYTLKFPSQTGWKKYPSNTMGLLNFFFTDLTGNPGANEIFSIHTAPNPTIYTCTTDANGFAQVLVPLGYQYSLSQASNQNFKQIIVKKTNPTDVFIVNIDYISITEQQRKAREDRRKRLVAIRDSITLAHPDVYNYAFNPEQITGIERSAEGYTKKLAKDPAVFIKEKKTVLAVMNRFNTQWKHKIIVVDVTGSMSPYMSEVCIWLAMKRMDDEVNRYVFFNDGDSKMTYQKTIGHTEGIYTIKSNNLDDVFVSMSAAQSQGGGGDAPENDVEALLFAEGLRSDLSEIILIADNYADMRDYSLISSLKIPVRVIACGADDDNSVNEQYINLAYKTGGSVHTLTEDILNLSLKNEGNIIVVSGKKYVLRNGEFLWMGK